MNLMNKFKSEFDPHELLLALFIADVVLAAKVEVLEKIAVEYYQKQGRTDPEIEAMLIHENKKAVSKRITDHKFFSDEYKEELMANLVG
jgi:hypothetical protein